ncbi:MAG: hypothetical protein JW797_00205 [Bradymonadales bacterium]|nr:hypothetical protein [Bradymonadales bacterium]
MRCRHPNLSILLWLWLSLSTLTGCSHEEEEKRLLGYWEGTLPLPATGETVPIAYQFREDGLTVWVGMGPEQIETRWDHWKVSTVHGNDLVVTIQRNDNRLFAALVRPLGEDRLILWDLGSDPSTAARVERREPP